MSAHPPPKSAEDVGAFDSDKIDSQHVEPPTLQGGQSLHNQLTTASEQQPDVAPDLQIRAVIVTIVVALYWITLLYSITIFGAYSRQIVAVLGDSEKQAWIPNTMNVVTVVLAPILSYMSDSFGDRISRKWFLIVPAVLAVVGNIIGSRANSVNMCIVGSAFIGVGAATLGIATAIPSEILPHKYRPAGQAFVFTASAPAGFPAFLGPASAIASDSLNGWRWLYYSGIIAWGVVAVLFTVFYSPPVRKTELTENRPRLDWPGYILLAAASVLFLMGLTWGGVTYAWNSGPTIGTIVAGVAIYVALGIWEWKGRVDGIFHHDLFKNRNFPLVLLAIFIEGVVYLGYVNVYPTQIATVYEPDLFKSAQLGLPFYGAFIISLPIGGWYASKYKDSVTPIIVGYAVFLGAAIGFTQSKIDSKGLVVAMSTLAGFGFAQPLTFLTVVAQFAAPSSLIATSTAIVLSVRALGGSVGTAVVNAIINSKVSASLGSNIAHDTIPLGLNPQLLGPVIGAATGDAKLIAAIEHGAIPGITPQILGAAFNAAHQTFLDAIKTAWIFITAVTAVALLSILLLKRNRHQLDYIIDAPLEHVHHRHAHQESQA